MVSFDPCELLQILTTNNVEFIVIGGIAGTIHGLATVTLDLDVIYRRTPENIHSIAKALVPINPYLRDVPEGLPFVFDSETITKGLNFTLTTTLGPLDFLGTAPGALDYDVLLPNTAIVDLCDCKVRVVTLDKLIEMKRGAGRPKDFNMISMLEALKDEPFPPEDR